ncbi:hypothetical protein C6P45_000966 [Maudiozyma exigua]|uniref:Alcohol acetyltransferase n=1 Tax=Maudiozyma exigua TaxID=34358 RepID=A0A9P7B7U9_MAUEX|nr:hypothetical protein C6P45_000966 [Kazachstania exigua]
MTLRELSSLEQYFYYRCKLKLHSCFYLAVTLNKLPNRDQLQHAISKTIKKFPQAHCTVTSVAKGQTPRLKDLTDTAIRFDDVVEYYPWESLCTENINEIFKKYNFQFDNGKPLWKIIVLEKTSQLIFAVSHIFFDGISSTIFANSILDGLNSETNTSLSLEGDIVYESNQEMQQLSLHPYDLWPIPFSWKIKRQLVKLLLKISPSIVTGTSADMLQFEKYNFPDDFITNPPDDNTFTVKNDNIQKLLKIKPDTLLKILTKCKQEKYSLTSFLSALFAIGLKRVSANNLRNGKALTISIPMNARSVCKETLNVDESALQLGDFILGMEYSDNLDTIDIDDLWTLSAKIKDFMVDFRENQISDQVNIAKLLDIADVESFVRQKVENGYGIGPGAAFEITNLGFNTFGHNAQDENEYVVTDAFFNQPQGFSNIFTCSIISTPIGGLNCCISYPKNLIIEMEPIWKYAEEIIDNI